MTLAGAVPEVLRAIRASLELTQAELAARSGVRRETISRIERSRVTSIDMTVLEKLATALGVEPGILIVRTPPRGTPRTRKPVQR